MSSLLTPGARVAERYELEHKIGEGGMGSVWRARHLTLGAPVAIKFVHVQGPDSERFVQRFEREAKLAASIRHRNVVSVTDYGHMPDGTAYMVMDHLEGIAFAEYLNTRPTPSEVIYFAEQITRGLVAVHEAGVVHRDLKPENVFIVEDATGAYPKLIDFGISKAMRPNDERRSAVTTHAGVIFGTPAYMAPEQARGLAEIDERADIYSMGVIMYEALAGRLPYDSPYVGDLLIKIVVGGAMPLQDLRPDLDPALCAIVMKAMAHDPRARHQSARELLSELVALQPGRGPSDHSDRPLSSMRAARPPTASGALPPLRDSEYSMTPSVVPTGVIEAASLADLEAVGPMRSGALRWVALAAVVGALGAITLLAWPDSPPRAAAPARAPAVSVAPAPPAQVRIELTGVPAGATVQLDGKPSGTRIELPRGRTVHEIRVSAEGHAPWSRMQSAERDATIAVALAPAPAPEQPSAPAVPAAEPTPKAGAKSAKRAHAPRPESPGRRVITELDY